MNGPYAITLDIDGPTITQVTLSGYDTPKQARADFEVSVKPRTRELEDGNVVPGWVCPGYGWVLGATIEREIDPAGFQGPLTTCSECDGQGGFVHYYGDGDYDGEACEFCDGTGKVPAARLVASWSDGRWVDADDDYPAFEAVQP